MTGLEYNFMASVPSNLKDLVKEVSKLSDKIEKLTEAVKDLSDNDVNIKFY